MNRLKKRAAIVLVFVFLFVVGSVFYCFRYVVKGPSWAAFSANSHCYKDGVLVTGEIYDRDGTLLSGVSGDTRTFAEDSTIRRALLHTVGDLQGNIGTSVLSKFKNLLMGYDVINGTYNVNGGTSKVSLTVDADVCAKALNALGSSKGTVLVCNYKTGEIICSVSTPTFDPKSSPNIDVENDTTGVYIDRALSSTYPPGSIFKIVTLAAAIDNIDDLFSRTFHCDGKVKIGDDTLTCLHNHGDMNIYEAFTGSCNCAFSELAQELGPDILNEYADKLGLTSKHYVDSIETAAGAFTKAETGTADLSWSGIGQYEDMVNPEAYLRLLNAIAGGGSGAEPRLISGVTNSVGLPDGIFLTKNTGALLSKETADKLTDMMRCNVVEGYGQSKFGDLNVCAKTGTAETGEKKAAHSWFVGFIDDDSNPYSFVVLVENGGSGLSVAGSVAATVLNYLCAEK